MDLTEIVAALRERGSDLPSVEAKAAAAGLPDSLTATMCAFANLPGGGLVVLGLDERAGFAPVALRDPGALAAGIASRARQAFDPPLQVSVDIESFEGAEVVVARVQELPLSAKPCIVKRTGQAYLRFSDGDYALSRLEMDGFVANRSRPRFDEHEVEGAAIVDLDPSRVDDFVTTARSSDRRLARLEHHDLLRRTGVVSVAGIPTVAGLIALGTYPQEFLPHYNVRAALHASGAASTTRALDSATFTGPIAAILEDAVAWVARNSRHRIVEDPPTGRVSEHLDPPPVAVRELVANALVHRDLAEWASSRAIELRMGGSTFRLTNPGGLYGITVDRLGVHPLTSARNRRLVEICKFVRTADGNVVEALASGIPATVTALRDAGLPGPQFFDQGLAFTVVLPGSDERPGTEISRPISGQRVVEPAVAPMITAAERQLLDVLDHPASVEAIARALGITENAAHKRLASLRSKRLIIINGGPGRPTTYKKA